MHGLPLGWLIIHCLPDSFPCYLQEPAENAAEHGAAQPQPDAVPAASDGAAHGLRDATVHYTPSATSSPSHGLEAPVATISGPQTASDAVCESLVDDASQPLFEPAPVSNAAADDQTALANLLNSELDAEQAAGSSDALQPAAAPAASSEALDGPPSVEQAVPAPLPLQPAERLAKGREVVALMHE